MAAKKKTEEEKTEPKECVNCVELTDVEAATVWTLTQNISVALTGAAIDAVAGIRAKLRPRIEGLSDSQG